MWALTKKLNRIYAERTLKEKGDLFVPKFDHRTYSGQKIDETGLIAYICSENAIYNRPCIGVYIEDKLIVKVTKKSDAISIAHSLKRDYPNIYIRYISGDASPEATEG